MLKGLKVINQTIATALPSLGVTVLDSDFIKGVSSAWNPITDKVTGLQLFDDRFDIGTDMQVSLTQRA